MTDPCPTKLRKAELYAENVTLDTFKRISGTRSDGKVDLQLPVNPKIIRVHSVQFPPFYNITEYNNEMRINGATTVTLTPGSYDTTALTAMVFAASGSVVTLAFSATTFLCTITGIASIDFNFSLKTRKLAKMLGFAPSNFAAGPFVGTSGINLNMKKIYLYIQQFPQRSMYKSFSNELVKATFDFTLKNDHNGLYNTLYDESEIGHQAIILPPYSDRNSIQLDYEFRDEHGDLMTYLINDPIITFTVYEE